MTLQVHICPPRTGYENKIENKSFDEKWRFICSVIFETSILLLKCQPEQFTPATAYSSGFDVK